MTLYNIITYDFMLILTGNNLNDQQTLGTLREHSETLQRSLRGHSEVIERSFRDNSEVIQRSLRNNSEIISPAIFHNSSKSCFTKIDVSPGLNLSLRLDDDDGDERFHSELVSARPFSFSGNLTAKLDWVQPSASAHRPVNKCL